MIPRRMRNSRMYDVNGKRRDGYPTQRRRSFTPDMWVSWWADRYPDEHTLKLRDGISEMRKSLK